MRVAHRTGGPGLFGRAPAPKATARSGAHVAPPHAHVLDLQRTAGNQAVAGCLVAQRAGGGVGVADATVPYRPVTDFDTMTLSELNDYADSRPDWSTDPLLSKARRRSLIDTLAFGRAGDPEPLGACGGMAVADLEKTKLTPTVRSRLRTYTRSVAGTDSVMTSSTDVVADALKDGESIEALESQIPKAALKRTMGDTEEGKAEYPLMRAKGVAELRRMGAYFRRSGAYLEADNGADIKAYREMVEEDNKRPDQFIGRLPGVINYHRFPADMLEKLAANRGNTTRKKPLLLILHAGTDHNGAYHRDHELSNLVKHPRNLSIMIEGPVSLEAAGSAAADVAKRYGPKKKIQQLMIAGHGDSQMMELGGKPDKDGKFQHDDMDIVKNKERTEKFLKGLVANMESGPDAKIVLNACLTAADTVAPNLSKDPAVAKQQILDSLKNSPSLEAKIQELAPGQSVQGNVSSVPAGKYMAEDAAGNPTGVMHQIIPSDPLATGKDRAAYVEGGQEAEGCMRAAVALWAIDKTEMLKRVEARRAAPIGDWDDRVIHVFYDLIVADADNVSRMNDIAHFVAAGLSEYDLDAKMTPRYVYGLHAKVDEKTADHIFGALHPHTTAGGRLAMDCVWMIRNASRRPVFMTELDAIGPTTKAASRLAMGALKHTMAALLPVASAKTPTSPQMKLALWAVTAGGGNADAEAFLKANAGNSGAFAMPAGTTVEGLTGGSASENAILKKLGLLAVAPDPNKGGVDIPKPNMDLDGDGINETFVRSITREGRTTASMLNVRDRPDISGNRIDGVPAGRTIDVIGESGEWFMIDLNRKVGFVHRDFVKERAIA